MPDPQVPTLHKPLTPKQWKFVNHYLRTGVGSRSVIEAGYSAKGAADTAHRLLTQHPGVMAAVAAARNAVAAKTEYDSEQAMREAEEGMTLSIEKNQMNAYMKGVELRAKIMGVLRDQMDVNVKHFDISSTLAEARKRTVLPGAEPIEDVEFIEVPDPFAK